MNNLFDFIGYLQNWCNANNIYLISGPESYQNAVVDWSIYENFDLIMCISTEIIPQFGDQGGIESVTYQGNIGLGRKREIIDGEQTISSLDETFQQKYNSRLQELTEKLALFFENLQCEEDAYIDRCVMSYALNKYDLNADFVVANIQIRFTE